MLEKESFLWPKNQNFTLTFTNITLDNKTCVDEDFLDF